MKYIPKTETPKPRPFKRPGGILGLRKGNNMTHENKRNFILASIIILCYVGVALLDKIIIAWGLMP